MKTEAETEVMPAQAKDAWDCQGLKGARQDPPQGPQRERGPANTDFKLLASRTENKPLLL